MPRARTKDVNLKTGRVAQKQRTRSVIVAAATELVLIDEAISMASIAERAGVSLATVYRNFPDLPTLQLAVAERVWRKPDHVLAPLDGVDDPVARIRYAAADLLTSMLRFQRSVRAVVAASLADPGAIDQRPALRLPLIEAALAPARLDDATVSLLREQLAVLVGPEALFVLTDVVGLNGDAAVARLLDLAETVVRAALDHGDTLD